jgi:hypothetical protein
MHRIRYADHPLRHSSVAPLIHDTQFSRMNYIAPCYAIGARYAISAHYAIGARYAIGAHYAIGARHARSLAFLPCNGHM